MPNQLKRGTRNGLSLMMMPGAWRFAGSDIM